MILLTIEFMKIVDRIQIQNMIILFQITVSKLLGNISEKNLLEILFLWNI